MYRREIKHIGTNRLYLLQYTPFNIKWDYPLVFIHGRHGAATDWEHYLEYFSKHGWKCYALSLRGHFGCKPVDISQVGFMDFVEDISTVIKYIQSTPVLIGFSMGGRVAQKYAEGGPLKGLILLNSTEPKGTMPRPARPETLKNIPLVVAPDRQSFARAIGEEVSPELFDRVFSRMSKESGKVIKEMMAGIEVDPSRISCPVLVIDTDSPGKCDRLARFYNAEQIFLKGISHAGVIWGSRWTTIAEKIKGWLYKKIL